MGTPLLKLLEQKYYVKLFQEKKFTDSKNIKYIRTKNLLLEKEKWWEKHLKNVDYFIFLSWDVSSIKLYKS